MRFHHPYAAMVVGISMILLLACNAYAGVIYVSRYSLSDGPGTDWAHAYRSVRVALNAATAGDEIWVSAGIYTESISLKDSVALYGGFAGSETARDQRNWKTNTSILEDGKASSVVLASSGVGSSTRIDGFLIRSGTCGIACSGSSPTIVNNVIAGNREARNGSGISCVSNATPVISCNVITGNYATTSGGGIYCSDSSPTITNNTITGNSGAYGGGIYCSNSASPVITNNTITANVATQGGGVYITGPSTAVLANNIVAFNSSGLYADTTSSPILIADCIYGNTEYNWQGTIPGSDSISEDPVFAAYSYGNLHIRLLSPCRNQGSNTAPGLPSQDMDGKPRILEGAVDIGAYESNGTQPANVAHIVFVDSSAPAGGNGQSWSTACRRVQDAIYRLAAQGGEVWVKAGTYNGCIALLPFTHLYGGFAGNETTRDSRNWAANITALDGRQAGTVVTVQAGYMVSTISGFRIRNGSSGGVGCIYSSTTIVNNVITANFSAGGGGIHCYASPSSIANNLIIGNSSQGAGGGIYADNSPATMVNNTIVGNTGSSSVRLHGSTMFINNIVAFNSTGIARGPVDSPLLRKNCVYQNTGYDYSGFATVPTGHDGNISLDPKLASTEYGDTHIQPGSPCIDGGDSGVVSWACDSDGQARVFGPKVDIGAYEFRGDARTVTPGIVRVSSAGSDTNDGSTWAQSKRTIQAAISAVSAEGGEVWVKGGIYQENVVLAPYVQVYGGFGGTETSRSTRNWVANPTAIDGQRLGSTVAARAGYVPGRLDGFIIGGGNASLGGGVYCSVSSVIANCVVAGNSATARGGGIYCSIASPTIVNTIVRDNTAGEGGGGICCNMASPTVLNCTIAGNTAGQGGGVHCYQSASSPRITNTIIALNSSGIYGEAGGAPVLAYNCMWANTGYDCSGIADPMGRNGNIKGDPRFVGASEGDYHINSSSACIDSGTDTGAPSTDYDGVKRPQNGNSDGMAVCDIGAFEYPVTLGSFKRTYPDGASISCSGVVVTAVFPLQGWVYVENADRSAGIRVATANPLTEGDVVSVAGMIGTDVSTGERYVQPDASSPEFISPGTPLRPVGMSNKSMGGGPVAASTPGQQGVVGSTGVNNIGLLVRVWGKVIEIDPDPSPSWLRVDDGSSTGVRVVVPSDVVIDTSWTALAVTGISSCEKTSTDLVRLLRVRRQSDLIPQ